MLTRLEGGGGVGGGEPGEGLGVLTTVILNLALAELLLSLLLAPDASCDAGVLHSEDRILMDLTGNAVRRRMRRRRRRRRRR